MAMYPSPAHVPGTTYLVAATNYASFWRRAFASFLDSLILFFVSLIGALILMAAFGLDLFDVTTVEPTYYQDGYVQRGVSFSPSGSWWSVFGLGGLAYYVLFHARGATIGKMALGIRVVDGSGNPPGLRRAVLRVLIPAAFSLLSFLSDYSAIFAWLSSIFWLFAILDGLSMLWHIDRQTIHDRIAGTYVVRD
jgi:uncharacterized RDD family membrane protein YckC